MDNEKREAELVAQIRDMGGEVSKHHRDNGQRFYLVSYDGLNLERTDGTYGGMNYSVSGVDGLLDVLNSLQRTDAIMAIERAAERLRDMAFKMYEQECAICAKKKPRPTSC